MLSRSGLSIRKFIPHRRLSDEDLNGNELKNEDLPRASWTDQEGDNSSIYSANRSPNRKKRALAPIIATSPLTHSDILRPLPPIPNETPRSSASSSCRCERHVECDCPLLSWKRRSPLYSIISKEDGEDSSLLSCINNSSPDDTMAQHIPKSRFYLTGESTTKEGVTRAPSPQGEHKEDESKLRRSEESSSRELSEDVQQFMQETEDAFKAIGSTLSEVQVNRTAIPEVVKADSLDIPRDPEPTPPTPPPKETRLSFSNSSLSKASSILDPSPPNTPPKDNAPMQKPKRRKSKKSRPTTYMRPTRKNAASKQATKNGPRWTLSENVSELLTGKLFHRMEVDEMLTPDQIEAFKQQRITKLQVDKMAAALEQEIAETPIEPFHLEDLPSRIGSAGVKTELEEDLVPRSLSIQRQHDNNTTAQPLEVRPLFHKNNTPPKSSRHIRTSSRKLATDLPVIPEASPAPRTSDDLSFNNASDDFLNNSFTPTSEYIYLKSTRYSLITPAIQHGPIRLSKSDLVQDMKFGGDDGLDWTAYQMAILGGAGDFLTESSDTIRQEEEDEIADLTEWWDSFHLESTGELVTRNSEASSPTSTLSGDEIPDLPPYIELDIANPRDPRQRWQEARHNACASGLQLDLGFTNGKTDPPSHYFVDEQGNMNDTWRRDSEEKEVVVNRQSLNSLPPSPMLDLRVIRSSNGDDLDVVPMGYNLGHDLGDFLKWEAQHAYAGDFNSPSGLM
ncbi:hypothetical protein EV127DRAFT_139707 [Xylaria flabelliformis]|nr:hypothetical protein EV127DRAFT_139707 [Xylaria flabelliformis]